jgi:hypothetical protein
MDGDIDNDDLGLIKDYINCEAGDDFNKDIADTNGDSLNAIIDVFFYTEIWRIKGKRLSLQVRMASSIPS